LQLMFFSLTIISTIDESPEKQAKWSGVIPISTQNKYMLLLLRHSIFVQGILKNRSSSHFVMVSEGEVLFLSRALGSAPRLSNARTARRLPKKQA
jgi:hypothetical protein